MFRVIILSSRRNPRTFSWTKTRPCGFWSAAVLVSLLCLFPKVSGRPTWNLPLKFAGGSSPATLEETSTMEGVGKQRQDELLVVFSDLDGTLIHYPENPPASEEGNEILKLPPSSTGMRGIISSKTLSMVQDIRRKNVKFVLVSGMRTSTFLSRLPYLPRADAYATEAGGRIFYPTLAADGDYEVKPQKYDGAAQDDLKPFGLVEDMEWRKQLEAQGGDFDSPSLSELAAGPSKVPDLSGRNGLLWDFARHLTSKGYVLDMKGYSACFRVNKKQQTFETDKEFEALLKGDIPLYSGLATSVNLSCIDFYPEKSGKKNCCQYLAKKFNPAANKADLLAKHAVCICDDDNDLEMALACGHAYIPEVSSSSMANVMSAHPDHFTQTGGEGQMYMGTAASESALSLVLVRLLRAAADDNQS